VAWKRFDGFERISFGFRVFTTVFYLHVRNLNSLGVRHTGVGDVAMKGLRSGWLTLIIFSVPGCGEALTSAMKQAKDQAEVEQAGLYAAAKSAAADPEIEKLLMDKDGSAEARGWLHPSHSNHVLWKGDRERITTLVNDLYAAGAESVHAVEILKEQGTEIVAQFVVTLPPEPRARQRVLRVHNEFWKSDLGDGEAEDLADFTMDDHGQRYVEFNFDL